MPHNKSHHFVPQLLLRRFSLDGASVGLCNLRSGKIAKGASIKHQACRDWFYGRDGKAEHSLGQIEGDAAAVLKRIMDTGRPPKRYTDDHRVLASFLLIQSARTAQAAAEANEMVNKFGKLMLRNALTDPDLLAALDDMTIELTEPAAQALRPALLETPVILDLKVKLLHNRSSTPFVLGDHPAIKHNELYSRSEVSVLGLANVGLQMLMPISPEYAVVLYDENAYRLGNPGRHLVQITSASVAMALNEFQWANALENVYFRPDGDPSHWALADGRLEQLRRAEHVSVAEEEIPPEGGKRRKLVTVQTHRPSRALRMPLFRNRVAAQPLINAGMLPLRDPAWAHHVRRMTIALDGGLISPEEFHARTLPRQILRRILKKVADAGLDGTH